MIRFALLLPFAILESTFGAEGRGGCVLVASKIRVREKVKWQR